MYLKSGYKTITGGQFLNGLALLEAKRISYRCFRVYLASFAVTAVREAAARARRKNKVGGREEPPRYRVSELARLCDITEGQARKDLRLLALEQVLKFSEAEILQLREILPETEQVMSLLRSPARPVPVS